MIAKGTHTITETVERRCVILGAREVWTSWIAMTSQRGDGWFTKQRAPSKKSSGMNIQEIPERKFLRKYRRTWRNGLGWVLEFDKDGLTGKGFVTDGSGVVDRVNLSHGYIGGGDP